MCTKGGIYQVEEGLEGLVEELQVVTRTYETLGSESPEIVVKSGRRGGAQPPDLKMPSQTSNLGRPK
jgi:hypothetical protein